MNTHGLHLEFLVSVPPECEQFFGDQGVVRLNSMTRPSYRKSRFSGTSMDELRSFVGRMRPELSTMLETPAEECPIELSMSAMACWLWSQMSRLRASQLKLPL